MELDSVDKKDFMDKAGVTGVLITQICSGCQEDDCGVCGAVDAISELEEQICEAGIEYMKEMAMKYGGSSG